MDAKSLVIESTGRPRAPADPHASDLVPSGPGALRDLVMLWGVGPSELERVLEDALEKLKTSGISAVLDGFEPRAGWPSSGEPPATEEDRAIRFVFEKIYDSVGLLPSPPDDPDAEPVCMGSLLMSSNRPPLISQISGVPPNSRSTSARPLEANGPDRLQSVGPRKRSTDGGCLDLVDSMPIFQSALSQAAFLQFYEDKRRSFIQKSANLGLPESSPPHLLVSRRAQTLFNQLAADIVGAVLEEMGAPPGPITIQEERPAEGPERATKTSVIVSGHKNTLDTRRQFDVQIEQDFDKYLNLQSKNLQDLHVSEINHRLMRRDSNRENKARGKSPVKCRDSLGPTRREDLSGHGDSGQPLGGSEKESGELSPAELQRLVCVLFDRLQSHPSEAEFCAGLRDRPRVASLLKRQGELKLDGPFKN